MITINDVKPDTIMELTTNLDRLFKVEGCNPACHACKTYLVVGDEFRLASTPDGRDVMLCSDCTMTELIEVEKEEAAALKRKQRLGFSRVSR